MLPREYLGFYVRLSRRILSQEDNCTSMMTIANEYVSDFFVGRADLTLSASPAFFDSTRSSGARQRVEPLPFGVEALTERLFIVIDENPKSVRRGLPWGSMRMFDCFSLSQG